MLRWLQALDGWLDRWALLLIGGLWIASVCLKMALIVWTEAIRLLAAWWWGG